MGSPNVFTRGYLTLRDCMFGKIFDAARVSNTFEDKNVWHKRLNIAVLPFFSAERRERNGDSIRS